MKDLYISSYLPVFNYSYHNQCSNSVVSIQTAALKQAGYYSTLSLLSQLQNVGVNRGAASPPRARKELIGAFISGPLHLFSVHSPPLLLFIHTGPTQHEGWPPAMNKIHWVGMLSGCVYIEYMIGVSIYGSPSHFKRHAYATPILVSCAVRVNPGRTVSLLLASVDQSVALIS